MAGEAIERKRLSGDALKAQKAARQVEADFAMADHERERKRLSENR